MSHTVSDPRRYWTDEREQGKACSGTCRSAQHITASVPKSALPTTLLKHHLDSVAGDYHGSSWKQCGTKTSPYGRRPDRLKTVFHDPNTSTLNNKIKKRSIFKSEFADLFTVRILKRHLLRKYTLNHTFIQHFLLHSFPQSSTQLMTLQMTPS